MISSNFLASALIVASALTGDCSRRSHDRQIIDEINKSIWPRDIFGCLEVQDCSKPIRGWSLFIEPGLKFDGAIDVQEGVITATKVKNEPSYFWYRVRVGIENRTGQSVYEVRVKQLETKDEDPSLNKLTVTALWSDDHEVAWEPYEDGNPDMGSCINHPFSGLSSAMGPVSKEDCANKRGTECTLDEGVESCRTVPPVTLKPYKETPPEREIR